jgi:hypothetical protein
LALSGPPTGAFCQFGKIERMGATSRDHVVFVVCRVVLAEGSLWPI